jgi:hypothetical protein
MQSRRATATLRSIHVTCRTAFAARDAQARGWGAKRLAAARAWRAIELDPVMLYDPGSHVGGTGQQLVGQRPVSILQLEHARVGGEWRPAAAESRSMMLQHTLKLGAGLAHFLHDRPLLGPEHGDRCPTSPAPDVLRHDARFLAS